jgi:hypothetical protein
MIPGVFLGQDEQPPSFVNLKKDNARFVIKAYAGIPKPITSNMFRKSFNGFYDAGISCSLRTVGNFYFGIGYQNIFFKNNSFLKAQVFNAKIPYDTRLLGDCAFATLSYDKFIKERAYVTYGLSYGYIVARYTNVNNDTSSFNQPLINKDFAAQYIKPEVSFNFIDSDNPWASFSVSIAYTTLLYKYDPKAPRFNHFQELRDLSNRYFASWLTIGFGVNILLGRKD